MESVLPLFGISRASRAMRNNNPGNIRIANNSWVGKVPIEKNTDGDFEQFTKLFYGVRALMLLILQDLQKSSTFTISGLINEYAPSFENQTQTYIANVEKWTNISRNQRLYPTKNTIMILTKAIIRQESVKDFDKIKTIEYVKAWDELMKSNKYRSLIMPESKARYSPPVKKTVKNVPVLAPGSGFDPAENESSPMSQETLVTVLIVLVVILVIYSIRKHGKK